MEQQSNLLSDLQVDQVSHSYLSETAKWAKFLGIIGFVFCGLMILMAIFAGTLTASLSRSTGNALVGAYGAGAAFFYIICAVIIFFPYLYLYKFANSMQVALHNNDQQSLNSSFSNLKSYFKYLGIITMIGLVFFALALIFSILGNAVGRM